MKVEQVVGLPLLDIKVDKAAIARYGLSVVAVQDVIGAAIGGAKAGVVFEGDRRFPIVVRSAGQSARGRAGAGVDSGRVAARTAGNDAGRAAEAGREFSHHRWARTKFRGENGKRRVVVSANVRGRDIASVVDEAQAKIEAKVTLPPGYWIVWGGQFENLAAARGTTDDRRAGLLLPDLPAALLGARRARDALLVFTAVPLALIGRHRRAVAARHAVLDFGGGRLHRAVGRRRAQRPRHAHLYSTAHREAACPSARRSSKAR